MITAIRAFEGGYCRQLLAMVDRRSLRWVKFQAVFLALHHEREGWILVDTGYGTNFAAASRRFPFRFYRWATPATSAGTTRALLAGAGISDRDVRHLIITHFHADHVGGLAEFPEATVHHHADALSPLQHLPAWRQVRAAFLPALIPSWLPRRSIPLPGSAFGVDPDLPFRTHDLFGDGSVRLAFLPGHAPGQLGVIFNSPRGREFYAADAFWRECQLTEGVEPLGIAMALQWDPPAYRTTVAQLRELLHGGKYRITACHDEATAGHFNAGASNA